MQARMASWLRVPTKTFQLLRLLTTHIHLSNGDTFSKFWNKALLQQFSSISKPCVQKNEIEGAPRDQTPAQNSAYDPRGLPYSCGAKDGPSKGHTFTCAE